MSNAKLRSLRRKKKRFVGKQPLASEGTALNAQADYAMLEEPEGTESIELLILN